MKKICRRIVSLTIWIVLLSTTVASALTSDIYPQAGKLSFKYDDIYYRVANRFYQDYKAGKMETTIALKGVDFEAIDKNTGVDRIGGILMGLHEMKTSVRETKQGDITIIQAKHKADTKYVNTPELNNVIDKLVSEVKNKSSIKEKLGYINDKLVQECSYGRHTVSDSVTAEGALVYKQAVCNGFADAVHEICERLGVKSTYILSNDHVANLIYIDNEWCLWDLTWNVSNKYRYGKEDFYYAIPTDDGDVEFVMGPGERKYFLVDLDSILFSDYYAQAKVGSRLGETEMILAMLYPNMSDINLSLSGIEVDTKGLDIPDSSETPNQNTTSVPSVPSTPPSPTPTPKPIDESTIIEIDGQGNIITKPTPKNDNKKTAKPNPSTVLVNGKKVAFEAYGIEGYNYFKLRDLAMALNGTAKKFEVSWDAKNNAVRITSKSKYTVAGGELVVNNTTATREATVTPSKIYIDGKEVKFTAYGIAGYNYFKLRDIGKALNFGVLWDGKNNTIRIDTSVGYTE